jgi:hypothetical protein
MLVGTQINALHSLLTRHSAMVFSYGVHDCAAMAANALSIGGRRGAMPTWRGRKEALTIVGGDLLACARKYFGDPDLDIKRAGIGDVGYAKAKGVWGIVLCVHDGVKFVAPAMRGVKQVPKTEILGGWVN